MKDLSIDVEKVEQEIISFEVSDEALESAAMPNEINGAQTAAFCSGLSSCPA